MKQAFTRDAVTALLASVPRVSSPTLAMGFTANLDLVLAAGPALTARMQQWCAEGTAAEGAVWRAILDAQRQCEADGGGAEVVVEPAEVLRRLDDAGLAMTCGGTGVRAAAQAARLGRRSIVSVPADDPRLASFLPRSLVSLAPAHALGDAARLPTHYVLEMPDWPAAPTPPEERIQTRRSNRLIVRGEEPLSLLLPDSFIAQVAQARPAATILLLSGFNTYTCMPLLEHALAQALPWLHALRQHVPGIWIYLELAGFTSSLALRRVLEALGTAVDIVGMNEDECAAAVDLRRDGGTTTPTAEIAMIRETLARFRLRRLVVHTAWMSSYSGCTPLAPAEQSAAARALALGNTAAGFRFAFARDGEWHDLRLAARAWELSRAGIACAAAADGYRDMVVIPAWDVPEGAGTIGLGDTFTGALLSGLDPSARAGP